MEAEAAMQKDFNSATKEELVEVPTISPTKAASILDWRESHGPVSDMTELNEIPGVGPKTVQRIAEHFTASGTQQPPNEDEDENGEDDENGGGEEAEEGEVAEGEGDDDPDEDDGGGEDDDGEDDGDEPDEAA
jgi:competence ComEA-like helix-hairpin-helix protein